MSNLNTIPTGIPPVKPNFSWTASGPLVSYSVNGDTYTSSLQQALINYPVPFDATDSGNNGYPKVIVPHGVFIIEYRWDFGDGTIGYGPQPTHTFISASPDNQVTLTTIDNRGLYFSLTRIVPIVSGLHLATLVPYKIRH